MRGQKAPQALYVGAVEGPFVGGEILETSRSAVQLPGHFHHAATYTNNEGKAAQQWDACGKVLLQALIKRKSCTAMGCLWENVILMIR